MKMDTSRHWLVLRCAGASTLPLCASLSACGYEVWTPTEVQVRLRPRTKAKAEHVFAILPSYVFAKARHAEDLAALSHRPGQEHKDFSVWHVPGRGVPLIADEDLAPLRLHERRMIRRDRVSPFARGDRVEVPDGPYAGIEMFVREARKNSLVLEFSMFGRQSSIHVKAWHVLHSREISAKRRVA